MPNSVKPIALGLGGMLALLGLADVQTAAADDEASNYAHVVARPYGRCYAKSVPRHIYDPDDAPRQQGRTWVYLVTKTEDRLVQEYNWFSQTLFVRCRAGADPSVVRVGPWQRGHNPRADHLAIAFYRGGTLIRNYSTMDIAGDERAPEGSISNDKNVSASVSHYTVFASGPQLTRVTGNTGAVFTEEWVVTATTVDGRKLVFDLATGVLQ